MTATILSFLKAIPGVVKIFESLWGMFNNYRNARIDNKYDNKTAEVSVVIQRIKKAKTNAERKELVKLLNSLK